MLNKGWAKASSIDILCLGLKTIVLFKKSIHSGVAAGNKSLKSTLFLALKLFKYSTAFSSVTKLKSSSSLGVPITENITFN